VRDVSGMRVLSVQQPWAFLIVCGWKDIENRTWGTRYRGRVLIHAGKQLAPWPETYTTSLRDKFGIDLPALRDLDRGGIVGITEIIESVEVSESPWFTGPHGFVLRNSRRLPFFPCRGALGFFTAPVGFTLAPGV